MKKWMLVLFLFISILSLTGCEDAKLKEEKVDNNFITVQSNEDGEIIIDTEDITSTATFVNYEVDDVMIGFIVVRGTDGRIRIAFNTCGSCNPSPDAYFIQVGEYLQCQNCRSKIHIDKVGVVTGGCNPVPVEEKEELTGKIIMDQEYVDSYKVKFMNWNGPTA